MREEPVSLFLLQGKDRVSGLCLKPEPWISVQVLLATGPTVLPLLYLFSPNWAIFILTSRQLGGVVSFYLNIKRKLLSPKCLCKLDCGRRYTVEPNWAQNNRC